MYPADRWKPGETLEDRVLVQLPPFSITPGSYELWLGAYVRSTGERIPVIDGGTGDAERVRLGSLVVTPLHPMVQQLIPPTRVETMRKYPERIVDSHRALTR